MEYIGDVEAQPLHLSYDKIIKNTLAQSEEHGRAIGEEHGRAIGEEHGRAIGEEHGRAIGEEHGRAIGEERGRAIGEERGKATAQMEIALNAFRRAKSDSAQIVETLQDFGVSDDIITAARRQIEAERTGELRSGTVKE